VTVPPGLTELGVMIMFAAQAGLPTARAEQRITTNQSLFMLHHLREDWLEHTPHSMPLVDVTDVTV
jgi:hypothetical protein